MRSQAAARDYDAARILRDRLRALEHAALPHVVELDRPLDSDVLWLDDVLLAVLSVRDGRTVERRSEASALTDAAARPSRRHLIANAPAAEMLRLRAASLCGEPVNPTRCAGSGREGLHAFDRAVRVLSSVA